MIVVGFLICVAAGYFVQPAAKRAVLRMSKCWPFTPSVARRQRMPAVLTAEWVTRALQTDVNVLKELDMEMTRIRRELAKNEAFKRHRY